RGPVLADDDGDWIVAAGVRADVLVGRAAGVVAAAALAAGDHTAAIVAAEAQLGRDPHDEVALRTLMRAHAGEGRPGSGLAAYGRVRRRLADDLGVSPAPETERLHTALLLAGTDDGPAPAERRTPTRTGRLVGRAAELADLGGHLRAAAAGVRVVQVEGDPGIGKSALVRRFVADLAAGTRVVWATTDDLGRDLPLQPVLDALGLAPPVALGPGGSGRARQAWFGDVLAAVAPPGGQAPGATTVLVVEDVHRADAGTRELLEWSVGRPVPVLVVATTRPARHLAGAATLALGPLAIGDLAELIGGTAPGRLAEIHARTAGNPLFALAVAAAPPGELPASVQEAVLGAIAPLGDEVRDVVQAAAVLGGDVDVDLVASVLRRPAVEVLGLLEEASRSGVLVESGAGFGFRHYVVREVLEAGAGRARVALLHRAAAATLAARPGHDPLAVAVHAHRGGDGVRAGRAFAEAARASLARADLAAAEAHLRSALACGDPGARTELARVLMVARRFDEAATEAAAAVASDGGPVALEVAGWIAYYRRDHGAAQRYADEAVERAGAHADLAGARAGALALSGRARHGVGDLTGARERLEDALDGDPAARGVARVWLAHVALHRGAPSRALDLAERALVDPDHHAHPFSPLHGAFARAVALGCLGQVAAGLAAADRFEEMAGRAGPVGARFVAIPGNVRSWLLRAGGRFGEADDEAQRSLEAGGAPDASGPSATGFAEAYWVAVMELADGRLAAGDLAGADGLLARLGVLDGNDVTMAWHQRHRRDLVAARIARRAGDHPRAAGLAAAVVADASARGAGRYASLARAELALAGGPADPADLDRVLDALDRSAMPEAWPIALELSGHLGVPAWRARAERSAARLVAAVAAEHRRALEALLARSFG
ncbi:MAG: BTAD domain-containing putative transcriptional regulator, partial [Acidimicrobiia bacterium]